MFIETPANPTLIMTDIRAVAEADPAIGKRLGDIGTIMSLRGPSEFEASVDQQRVELAAIAKTLGLKPAP